MACARPWRSLPAWSWTACRYEPFATRLLSFNSPHKGVALTACARSLGHDEPVSDPMAVQINTTASQTFSTPFHSNASAVAAAGNTSIVLGSFVEFVVEFPWWEFSTERLQGEVQLGEDFASMLYSDPASLLRAAVLQNTALAGQPVSSAHHAGARVDLG
jgi:hypothetical protein